MSPDALLGIGPHRLETAWLCAAVAGALLVIILGGFALLWRASRSSRAPRELGLLGLWRLGRATRLERPIEPAGAGLLPQRLAARPD